MNEQKQTSMEFIEKKVVFVQLLQVVFRRLTFWTTNLMWDWFQIKGNGFLSDWRSQSQLTVVQSDCRQCCLSWFAEADESDVSRWKTACFVLCFTLGASSPLHAAPLPLSSPMRSNQRRIDGIAVVYRLDLGGLFWLGADFHVDLWQKGFSQSLTFNVMNSDLTFGWSEAFVFIWTVVSLNFGVYFWFVRGCHREKISMTGFAAQTSETWWLGWSADIWFGKIIYFSNIYIFKATQWNDCNLE